MLTRLGMRLTVEPRSAVVTIVAPYETMLERAILDGLSTVAEGRYVLDVLPRLLSALITRSQEVPASRHEAGDILGTMTGDRSNAELRDAVITGWHQLGTAVGDKADKLDALVKLTGLPFRQLDLVRRVRNQIAHPDQPVPRERLLAALRVIADAELRINARRTARRQNDSQTSRQREAGKSGQRQNGARTSSRRQNDTTKSGRRQKAPARPSRKGRAAAGPPRTSRPGGRRQASGGRRGAGGRGGSAGSNSLLRRPSTLVAVAVVVAAVAVCVVMFDLFPS